MGAPLIAMTQLWPLRRDSQGKRAQKTPICKKFTQTRLFFDRAESHWHRPNPASLCAIGNRFSTFSRNAHVQKATSPTLPLASLRIAGLTSDQLRVNMI
jgi:hypothetical protein